MNFPHLTRLGLITLPAKPRKPNPHRTHLPSVKECRAACICIHCRTTPAKFYGPGKGYGVSCEACSERLNFRKKCSNAKGAS